MNFLEADDLIRKLMKEHGLTQKGWVYTYGNSNRNLGFCYGKRKLIKISKIYILNNSESMVKDTILHEIAHALTPGAGHSVPWKKKCIEIGCMPERCWKTEDKGLVMPKGRWRYDCRDKCGFIGGTRHNRRFGCTCRRCGAPIVWTLDKEVE